MARVGSFSRGAVQYGQPLGVIKPKDNNVKVPDGLPTDLKLTAAQRQELKDRVDELYAVLRGERDYLS